MQNHYVVLKKDHNYPGFDHDTIYTVWDHVIENGSYLYLILTDNDNNILAADASRFKTYGLNGSIPKPKEEN